MIPPPPSGHPFTNVQIYPYWSSTTDANSTDYAWIVDMRLGGVGSLDKSCSGYYDYDSYVWPVRVGQDQPSECSTWTDVISKYNTYVSGQAQWNDVITCYQGYVSAG
jgi:hypothetical protein